MSDGDGVRLEIRPNGEVMCDDVRVGCIAWEDKIAPFNAVGEWWRREPTDSRLGDLLRDLEDLVRGYE